MNRSPDCSLSGLPLRNVRRQVFIVTCYLFDGIDLSHSVCLYQLQLNLGELIPQHINHPFLISGFDGHPSGSTVTVARQDAEKVAHTLEADERNEYVLKPLIHTFCQRRRASAIGQQPSV